MWTDLWEHLRGMFHSAREWRNWGWLGKKTTWGVFELNLEELGFLQKQVRRRSLKRSFKCKDVLCSVCKAYSCKREKHIQISSNSFIQSEHGMTGKLVSEDRLHTSQSKKSSIGLIMKVMMIHWRLKSERAPNYKWLVKQSRGVTQSVFHCGKMNPQVREKAFMERTGKQNRCFLIPQIVLSPFFQADSLELHK